MPRQRLVSNRLLEPGRSTLGTQRVISHRPKASQEHWDKKKAKAKFYNLLSANTSQHQTQASKKNKHHESRWGDYPTIGVNATEVAKKDKNKDKAKDLSDIECYTCK